jgi:hypothetical protein
VGGGDTDVASGSERLQASSPPKASPTNAGIHRHTRAALILRTYAQVSVVVSQKPLRQSVLVAQVAPKSPRHWPLPLQACGAMQVSSVSWKLTG